MQNMYYIGLGCAQEDDQLLREGGSGAIHAQGTIPAGVLTWTAG